MSKSVKSAIVIIVIAVLAFLIIFFLYDIYKVKKSDTTNQEMLPSMQDSNTGLDNMIHTLFNTEKQELMEDSITNESVPTVQNTKEIEGTEVLNGTASDKEDKAIEIAKKTWGNDTAEVYFTIMGIDTSGKYIVEVKDKTTIEKLKQYIVDVETGRCIEK